MICPQCFGQFDVESAIERDGKWYCPDDNTELNDSDAAASNLTIKHFTIATEKPEEFIDKLEQLCKEYSFNGYYFFSFK